MTSYAPGTFGSPENYAALQKYLTARYADVVVLTFAQIEDLLGFSLPDPARAERVWWSEPAQGGVASAQSQSWLLAKRTATPNLSAETVLFERGTPTQERR